MNLKKMGQEYKKLNTEAMVTVYSNKDGYTKNNLKVDERGRVSVYDRSRKGPELKGVDIGFAFFRKEVLDVIPEGNVHFEENVYPKLVQQHQLGAFITDHRYYSVGSHERLPLTEAFFAPKKVVFLDRDGVLNRKAPPADYVKKWKEFEWLPGAKESIRLLKKAGYKIFLISNQAGIARGLMTHEDLETIHRHMNQELEAAGGGIDGFYVCAHGWDAGCECRKPKAGMLFQAQREHHLDLTKISFIGDDKRDAEAGAAAGCSTFLVTEDFGLLECVQHHFLKP